MIDCYEKLTLAKWAQIAALSERPFEDDAERQVAVLAILADKSEREVLNMPLPEYAVLSEAAAFLFQEPRPSAIAANGLRRLQLEGWTLVPTTDLRKLTTAQYVDYQTLIQGDADVHILLSCFLVPEGCKYCDGYEIADIHALLARSLTVPDALALKAFFLRRFTTSMRNFLTSCKWQILRTPRKVRREAARRLSTSSPQNGDGSTPSAASPTPRTSAGRTSGSSRPPRR